MASLSETPGFAGILHPMTVYRFRVRFVDSDGEPLQYSDDVSMQVTSVSDFVQTKAFGDAFGGSESFYIQVEEDVTGKASKALQQLFELEDSFGVLIEYLDGNESVVKTATFYGCAVNRITHGALDYAGGARAPKLRLRTPRWDGPLIEQLGENPAAQTVLTVLNGAELTLEAGESTPMTVRALVYIDFDKVVIS